MDVPLPEAVGIVACTATAAFFSLTEASLAALGTARAEKALQEGRSSLAPFVERPERVRYAVLFGKYGALITATILVGAVLGERAALAWGAPIYLLLAILLVEAGPRGMALARGKALAAPLMSVVKPWLVLLRPITTPTERLARVISPQNDGEPAGGAMSEEDLALLIDVGTRQGNIGDLKERILHSVFEFGDTLVREVMVPRTDVVAATTDTSWAQLIALIVDGGHSRIPVYRDNIDDICGVFYAKDLLQYMDDFDREAFDIVRLMRKPFFIPETVHINDLFKHFQQQRVHMAVVVNEFGGTAGIVTLEDIFEEFFGEIQDEHDDEEAPLIELGGEHIVVDARISVDEIADRFEIEWPEDDNYDTLGGFIVLELGEVPDAGAEVERFGLCFRVTQATQKRVERVEIQRVVALPVAAAVG